MSGRDVMTSATADRGDRGERVAGSLSIVVVNWNTRQLLLRLLQQLRASSGVGPVEIVVVDNASADGSADAVEAAFPAVRVVRAPHNGGFAYGVNRGVEAATGDWILLLNTDAEVGPMSVQRLLRAAAARPDGGVFGPRIVDEEGRVQRSTWRRHGRLRPLWDALGLGRWLDNRPQPEATAAVDCVSGCVFLMRRQALVRAGGMDERFFMYFEEADLCERVRAAGFSVVHVPAVEFVHRGGLSAAQARTRTFLAYRESHLLYHAALHGRMATEWVRACLLGGAVLRCCALWLLSPFGGRSRWRLHGRSAAMLARPGLVRDLCRRPRRVPRVAAG